MDINKETLSTILDHLSKFILLLIPGMIVMDFGMQRGFFSGGINNTIDFLFLLIWSVVFSFPYYIVAILIIVWNEVKSKSDADKIKSDPTAYETVLIFIFFLVFFHYVLFKIMLYYKFLAWTPIFEVDQRVAVCVVSMFTAFLLGFPISKLFYFLLLNIIARALGKHMIKERKK